MRAIKSFAYVVLVGTSVGILVTAASTGLEQHSHTQVGLALLVALLTCITGVGAISVAWATALALDPTFAPSSYRSASSALSAAVLATAAALMASDFRDTSWELGLAAAVFLLGGYAGVRSSRQSRVTSENVSVTTTGLRACATAALVIAAVLTPFAGVGVTQNITAGVLMCLTVMLAVAGRTKWATYRAARGHEATKKALAGA